MFLLLSLALSAFLLGHALLVQADFEACFGNYVASIGGERPYRRVAEMALGELAGAAVRAFSADQLIVAVLGLLPLAPFWIAWTVSRSRGMRKLWIVSAIVALIVIVGWTFTTGLAGFYDCDRSGVSLGLLLAPVVYAAATLTGALVLAALRSVFVSATGAE
ncbi:MAG TPA: hypothetical protein VF718_02405 [Allosphingosinicella sp.]|jgi:hypothetical protein